jgi:PAS domain S-box-containing protein
MNDDASAPEEHSASMPQSCMTNDAGSLEVNGDRAEEPGRLLATHVHLLNLIDSHDPLPELLETLCVYVESLLDGIRCSILLADPLGVLVNGAAPSMTEAYIQSIDRLPIREGVGSCGTAAARREMVIDEDVSNSPHWHDYRDLARLHGIAACWSTPIIAAGGELLGTCGMYYREKRAPGKVEIELIRFIGLLAAIVIQRHRGLARLATDEAHYRQLAEAMPDAILAHRDGRIVYRNAAAARLLGLDASAAVEPELRHFILDDDLGAHCSGVRTKRLRRSDGTSADVDVAATQITVHGSDAVLWVCRDVTHRVTVEQAILDASSREQEHLGYELHDGLGQQLTGVSLLLRALQRRVSPLVPDSTTAFEELAGLLSQAIEDLRGLAIGLSPVVTHGAGLTGALTGLAALTRDFHGLECQVKFDPGADLALDPTVATHLYRIAQEAVHNVVRHAGAQQVVIDLARSNSSLVLTIGDNGVGIPGAAHRSGGLGLRSMEYRARRIGSVLRVEPRRPRGTQVQVIYHLNPLVDGAGVVAALGSP